MKRTKTKTNVVPDGALSMEQIAAMAPAVTAGKPYHNVSQRYAFVPTIEVVEMLTSRGWWPTKARQARVNRKERSGFQRHLVRLAHEKDLVAKEPGDRVELVLLNSHDKNCAFALMAGIFRLVCENGLIVGQEKFAFRHKHIFLEQEELFTNIHAIENNASRIHENIGQFQKLDMGDRERKRFAKKATEIAWREVSKSPIKPEALLTPRRKVDEHKDLWTTYNVVQENLMKGGLPGKSRKSNRQVKTRQITSVKKDVKMNAALWQLTENTAARKEKKKKAA